MVRLGLLENAGCLASLTNKTLYEPLKNHTQIVSRATEQNAKAMGYDKYTFEESFVCLTDFGKSFCSICLGTPKISILKAEPQ